MRKITLLPILIFCLLLATAGGLTYTLTLPLARNLPDFEFRGIVLLAAAALFFLFSAVLVYRAFLKFFPLPPGDVPVGSRAERIYLVYILFWLLIFHPILRTGAIPVPMSRLVLLVLGTQVGVDSYSSGLVLDAHFVTIGSRTQIGLDALLIPHVQEGSALAHFPILVGDRVTIGARAIILAGVTIGDDAIVGTAALVTKGTKIGPSEIWAGVPARKIGVRDPKASGTA